MPSDRSWYHIIWNTHGSWLPGDPRGFRNHDHRIHSSGDYRSPPPAGEHQGLYEYNKTRTGPALRLPASLFQSVIDAILDVLARRNGEAAAISVAAEHVHVLAFLPRDYDQAREVVGKLKTISSSALRHRIPGAVWSRGCVLKRIEDDRHWQATSDYITQKQEKSALIWSPAQRKEPTASAMASPSLTAPTHATAEAVGSYEVTVDRNLFHQSDAVEVRRVMNRGKGGRAVIARRDIAKGELIERVPVLLVPRTQVFGPNDIAQRAARISWYVFEWIPTKRGYVALSLGYGSIYNHSDDPNAEYDMEQPDIMLFSAIKDINAGEEILISYAGGAGIMKELGFEAEKTPLRAADYSSDADSGAGGEEA